ncbi:type II secretion system protein [Massilia sp. 9096]|uniref:type II secretion system protein n=1 Tax=Massilia sp. 9096 TaxID=1500894 RepID=UPI0005609427|nr:prepilin-type N-terminal cleavage/methylation domain-containing protein [Massilia sp. 9096]
MVNLAWRGPARRSQSGFTLFEALLAILLLGTCLIPASYALRDALHGPADNAAAARNLDCVTNLMETVLASPYSMLYGLATSDGASAYPIPNETGCPARQVKIQLYGNAVTKVIGPGGTSPYLLYVSVSLADPADGNPYTLSTLVAR